MREIVNFFVAGAPVPWSTPRTVRTGPVGGKRGYRHIKAQRLCDWQDMIRGQVQGLSVAPYLGGVFLEMCFLRKTADEKLWKTPWCTEKPSRVSPDLTNLLKAAEDAICTFRRYHGTGVDRVCVYEVPGVIANDSQVAGFLVWKLYGERDGMRIVVYALE